MYGTLFSQTGLTAWLSGTATGLGLFAVAMAALARGLAGKLIAGG